MIRSSVAEWSFAAGRKVFCRVMDRAWELAHTLRISSVGMVCRLWENSSASLSSEGAGLVRKVIISIGK